MRLLHTADWHLGRLTYNRSREEDHDAVIAEITGVARQYQPHLIIHAGDVWDSVRPAYSDIMKGIRAFQELASIAPVVVVCGNHDSPELFRIIDALSGNRDRLVFVDRAKPPEDGGILTFPGEGNERIRLAPLPFVHQNRRIDTLDDPLTWMASYADRVQHIQDVLTEGLREGADISRDVLLFAAHLHVTGARFSLSERQITVDASYATRVERIPAWINYAAYGHIHRPQALPGTTPGRYAGSPIPLDFGEEGEAKEIVLVEARPGRPAVITPHRLSAGRPLKKVAGTIEEIESRSADVGTALSLVTVHSESKILNLADRIADLLPDATILNIHEVCADRRVAVITPETLGTEVEPSLDELFRGYLSGREMKDAPADDVLAMFHRVMTAVHNEEECLFPEMDDAVPEAAAT